ncbi:MAG TPA: GSCFA domain-containing protein [Thermomicrobiales bacterium]|nr:GSCFA domain-containing protein [Thermomicrobiales bacterium]
MTSPYSNLPTRSFWRPAVADRHIADFEEIAIGPFFRPDDTIATAGSCFAQHIGRHLKKRGVDYLDLEPAPTGCTPEEAHRHGFGIFSCRYGNIYTVRQLLQLFLEAFDERVPAEFVWEKQGRYYDAMRPGVDPVGHASAEDVWALREIHLTKVQQLFLTTSLFVFTLGLTEAWESTSDDTVFPTAPGTIAGTFDPASYRFHNFRYAEIAADLDELWAMMRAVNPQIRMLLTVSPVPLTATASGEHVLVATTQSKATLRAIAGDFAATHDGIDYFPSYELIATHPIRGQFFDPDLRNVNDTGVDYVMSHFFGSAVQPAPANSVAPMTASISTSSILENDDDLELICEEGLLDQFAGVE